jgi:hypothetical protein
VLRHQVSERGGIALCRSLDQGDQFHHRSPSPL